MPKGIKKLKDKIDLTKPIVLWKQNRVGNLFTLENYRQDLKNLIVNI